VSMPDEIPQGSVEFLTIEFDSPDDLTLGSVQLGLSTVIGDPPNAWLTGTWPTPGENVARTSVPVDFATISLGTYRVWAKLTDSPEIPERPYGTVRVV
jgi:hypothetical protein